jgi:hypothetical protein
MIPIQTSPKRATGGNRSPVVFMLAWQKMVSGHNSDQSMRNILTRRALRLVDHPVLTAEEDIDPHWIRNKRKPLTSVYASRPGSRAVSIPKAVE